MALSSEAQIATVDGTNKTDVIYVDTAAAAHLLAADRLLPGAPVAGKSYFVTQGEPVELWPFVNRILALAKLPPVTQRVSFRMAYLAGSALETWYRLRGKQEEPRMTRFLAVQLGTAHWFDITAARKDLGYEPAVSTDEGLKRMGPWLRTMDR